MATTAIISPTITELSQYKQALDTANLAVDYERTCHQVEAITQQEAHRKLRVQILLLEDEIHQINDQLTTEQEQGEELHQQLDTANDQCAELEEDMQQLNQSVRTKTAQLDTLKAELSAMTTASSDATKLLTEKLALSREITLLKPEVESLRAQVRSQSEILSEKLALERQLTTTQVELENAQRTIERNAAKEAKNHDRTEYEIQLDEAHKEMLEIKKEKKLAEREVERLASELATAQDGVPATTKQIAKAATSAEMRAQLDDLKSELQEAIKARSEAEKQIESLNKKWEEAPSISEKPVKMTKKEEKLTELRSQISDLKDQLKAETKARQTIEAEAEKLKSWTVESKEPTGTVTVSSEVVELLESQIDLLRKDMQAEKKERQKAEQALEKESMAWQAQKSLLDDKLDAFRTKLRSTKERLKETQEQLKQAKSTAPAPAADKTARNPRKRGASHLDESSIGTPGDGAQAAKRNKRVGSLVHAAPGDKSSFSITPFLNRTMSLAPDTPEEPAEEPTKVPTITLELPAEAVDSPSMVTKKARKNVRKNNKPLSQASTSKHNARPRKSARAPTLEKVLEEPSVLENDAPLPVREDPQRDSTTNLVPDAIIAEPTQLSTQTLPTQTLSNTTLKLKAPTKTSSGARKSLASFATFTEEPTQEKRKKRKLGAGTTKTLFDEDDEDKMPSKPIPGRGLFGGAKALARPFVFGAKKGSGGMAAADVSFAFSPLKKDRRVGSK
ncbi:hypothetical protein BT63DRAFT_443602 [Microthyrium microscopicum]|uniref:Uncharacterized protein n=1 Tax=Microthyrium microscopicum TaxID=703497 RepID=A0A6A6TYN2_9PEZI|nr:hypothetical protein BT63DRAFT_443602 [Microthyrium microscopicum]